MSEEQLPEFGELQDIIDSENGMLMDVNHEAMQAAREVVFRLRGIQERFNDSMEELIEAHIARAVGLARIAEDIILAEFNAEVAEGDDDEEDEEDE